MKNTIKNDAIITTLTYMRDNYHKILWGLRTVDFSKSSNAYIAGQHDFLEIVIKLESGFNWSYSKRDMSNRLRSNTYDFKKILGVLYDDIDFDSYMLGFNHMQVVILQLLKD